MKVTSENLIEMVKNLENNDQVFGIYQIHDEGKYPQIDNKIGIERMEVKLSCYHGNKMFKNLVEKMTKQNIEGDTPSDIISYLWKVYYYTDEPYLGFRNKIPYFGIENDGEIYYTTCSCEQTYTCSYISGGEMIVGFIRNIEGISFQRADTFLRTLYNILY